MTIQSASPATLEVKDQSRAIDTSELMTRMAEEMRAKSGSGLPLSYYMEQVKQQLAGGKSPEDLPGPSAAANGNTSLQSSDIYKAWAMPE